METDDDTTTGWYISVWEKNGKYRVVSRDSIDDHLKDYTGKKDLGHRCVGSFPNVDVDVASILGEYINTRKSTAPLTREELQDHLDSLEGEGE